MRDKEKPKIFRATEAKPEVTQEELAEILKKVDKESTARN
jgi:hypothetical protein